MIEKNLVGNMKWWDVAEQPDSFESLPSEFKEAYDLWSVDGEKNIDKIISLLETFLTGIFVPENISDFEDFFEFDSFPEVESYELKLVGVSFENAMPIPKVKTEAYFKVPFSDEVDFETLDDDLEERGGSLYDCISFAWVFDELEDLSDLDTSFGDHQGCEAYLSDN